MAKVKLDNIYKVYEGGVRAVNEFNLDIPDKEFVVFVGPSGCGKSTTLRMIAGLEDITQGKLYIDDEVVNDVESKNRDIAMVFQSYALYPHMTVYQNMAFGLKIAHTPKAEIDEKVKKAAEILEITDLLSRKPKALSGGQRQRVALGRAIVREPKVFLLDEPLSNLDAKLRVQMRSEITKLHEKLKTTFIYVTHDQTEAMTMGSRIVVMKDGFIQQADTPISIFEEPANLFVATFLGSPQMNVLNAKLSLKEDKLCATLFEAESKNELIFSDLKRNELVNDSYIGEEVKLGIRPESISIDPNGNIEGTVDVVEQLGDETIIYAAIPGLKQNLILKAPFDGKIRTKDKLKLKLDVESIHLFDAKTTNSIMGMRTTNDFDASIDGDMLIIGKNKIKMQSALMNTILPSNYGKKIRLSARVNDISVEAIPESIKLPIKVGFTDQKTDYISAYFKVDGLDQYFVIKLKNGTTNLPENIFIPLKNIKMYDENNNIVNSREVMYDAVLTGKIKERNAETITVSAGKYTFTVKNRPDYDKLSDEVKIKILPEGSNVVFNKKLLKDDKEHNSKFENVNLISFEAYDEYKANEKNFIYGKVSGFQDYVTFYVDNDFSVYKMPKFKVAINPESIVLF